MSWDLEFVPAEAEPDVLAWLETERDADPAAARRHAELGAAADPVLEPAGPFDGCYQLVSRSDDVPLTVDLDGRSATLNVAYWEGTTDSAAPTVARIAAALADAGPFLVFDPQAGEIVEPASVEARFREEHARISALASRLVPETDVGERPWYRRPGLLIAAGALVVIAIHRLGAV